MNKISFLPLTAFLLGATLTSQCLAEPPPDPWSGNDVGEIEHPGSVDYADGVFKLNGSGAEIWETSDSFYFVSQPLTGEEGTIIAHFREGLNFVDPFAKAGVMIRAGLDANAANVFLAVTSQNGATFQQRPAAGHPTTAEMMEGKFSSAAGGDGLWLKLERAGDLVTAFTSTDGKEWQQLGEAKFEWPGGLMIGLAITSHDAAQKYCFGTFDNVEVTLADAKK